MLAGLSEFRIKITHSPWNVRYSERKLRDFYLSFFVIKERFLITFETAMSISLLVKMEETV